MNFLSKSEREHLIAIIKENIEDSLEFRHENDYDLVKTGLKIASNIPERLFSMLHCHGRASHVDSNPGRTLLTIQKISTNQPHT
jgi:hypothetical protein